MSTDADSQIPSHTSYHSQIMLDNLDATSLRQIKRTIYDQVEQARTLGINLKACELDTIAGQLKQYECNHHMQSCSRLTGHLQEVYMLLKAAISSTSGDSELCIHFKDI